MVNSTVEKSGVESIHSDMRQWRAVKNRQRCFCLKWIMRMFGALQMQSAIDHSGHSLYCGQDQQLSTKKRTRIRICICPAALYGPTPPQPGGAAQLMKNRGGSVASVPPVGPVMAEWRNLVMSSKAVKARNSHDFNFNPWIVCFSFGIQTSPVSLQLV